MAWGKEEFRTKYRETNECIQKIKDNYYDLDHEYQMMGKKLQQKENIIKEVREEIKKLANLYDDNYTITDKAKDILEILYKEEE